MCGISGFVDKNPRRTEEQLLQIARAMTTTLRHRGPDDEGLWTDPKAGVALGSRRLAILDITAAGHQPMVSSSGRHVMVFNGEVYNHAELRPELEQLGVTFKGHSDTEVLLEAIQQWDVSQALRRVTGMFALAVWDIQSRTLTLARDRMGEKPLYYGWSGDTFFFGSELKALRAHPSFRPEIDRDALAIYLRHGYVPTPHSIYRGISKLVPGTTLEVRSDDGGPSAHPVPYWSMVGAAEDGLRNPLAIGEDEATDQLEELLRVSIRQQMVADVPVGAFLSGGIDSSTVVALMQGQSSQRVRTFTIGFFESEFDEAVHAKEVAAHLGTDHTELYVTPGQAQEIIPRLPHIYDEPFADSSQIPTFLVSELARREVTVSLSGDGGDELFGGYDRYRLHRILTNTAFRVPHVLRNKAAGLISSVPAARWDRLAGKFPNQSRLARLGDRMHKLSGVLALPNTDDLYQQLMSHWKDPDDVVIDGTESRTLLSEGSFVLGGGNGIDRIMCLDAVTYLPDDLLVKVDRASMAVSLETRLPLLDHHLVELVWRLPQSMKVDGKRSKQLLRRVLARHVPPALTERPKMGFGVPIGDWLREPLRDWAEELLDARRLLNEGFLRAEPVREAWAGHLDGSRDNQYQLWNVLMFQAWLESTSESRVSSV